MKLKPGYRLRKGDQVPTRCISIATIMGAPSFQLGVADARAGRGYHRDYDIWNTNAQWDYERGRMWVALAPRDMPLKQGGRITREAAAVFSRGII